VVTYGRAAQAAGPLVSVLCGWTAPLVGDRGSLRPGGRGGAPHPGDQLAAALSPRSDNQRLENKWRTKGACESLNLKAQQ